ncbi:MAG: hypothetical protein ACYCYK_02710 [Candidatus Dormibacteria bacterium]
MPSPSWLPTGSACAHNAESALDRPPARHSRRAKGEGRALLREAFRSSGNLEVLGGCPDVRRIHLSAPRGTRSLMALRDQLNQSETCRRSSDLALSHFANPPPAFA